MPMLQVDDKRSDSRCPLEIEAIALGDRFIF